MFKLLSDWASGALLFFGVLLSKVKFSKRTGVTLKKKLSITQVSLKEGDHYKLGEATVTLAKFGVEGKQEVAKKIAAADARRLKRQALLTTRAEEIMLMSPEEILEFQTAEWLEKRKSFLEKFSHIKKVTKQESELEPPPPSEVTP